MGNQLRALEAGLAVARVLDRMLVIPDYIADNGEGDSELCPHPVHNLCSVSCPLSPLRPAFALPWSVRLIYAIQNGVIQKTDPVMPESYQLPPSVTLYFSMILYKPYDTYS